MTRKSQKYIQISRKLNKDALEYVQEQVECGMSFPYLAFDIFSKTGIYVNPITINRWVNRWVNSHKKEEK